MNVFVVDGHQVAECAHCRGSGTCQGAGVIHTRLVPISLLFKNPEVEQTFECQRCGKGFTVSDGMPPRPTCAVCGGTGHNRI
jgi:hypothetical protein